MKVACIVGTRPEAIKMAPVILALRRDPAFECRVIATAQHREMLDGALGLFGIRPDIDLDAMRPGQSLAGLTARLMTGLDRVLGEEAPDVVLGQGDTTSVLTAALAAFYRGIAFGHVEAGLRTGDMRSPFPEEMNRVVAAHLSRWHFAPTQDAAARLLAEGYAPSSVHVTGNTVIDALLAVREDIAAGGAVLAPAAGTRREILVTVHRRENFGAPLLRICAALERLAAANAGLEIVIPVHPNPNVRAVLEARFAGHPQVRLSPPLGYRDFVAAMMRATLILTDSGGVQEEAPALGRPVLVLRETTERPEAVAAGVAALVGTGTEAIRAAAQRLLDDPAAYRRMAQHRSPYGDGRAASRIADVLREAAGLARRDAA